MPRGLAAIGLLVWLVSSSVAAETSCGPDEDFAWQGEYVRESAQGKRGWGLQVVALGGGQFRAALLSGGLPGYGADQVTRIDLTGQKEGQSLSLASANRKWEVVVHEGKTATISGVTDSERPLHKVGRASPTMHAPPPPGSIVLFDGRGTDAFRDAKTTSEGWLESGTELIPVFRDFTMHLEFMTPYMPHASSQGRGNSGVYIQGRYEVQILDSFGSSGNFNECGALYRYQKPSISMCLPPLTWQTYDITFFAPRYDRCGCKRSHATISLLHNGITVHDRLCVTRKTGAGEAEGPDLLPIRFQDHGNPVRFRNIWLVARGGGPAGHSSSNPLASAASRSLRSLEVPRLIEVGRGAAPFAQLSPALSGVPFR